MGLLLFFPFVESKQSILSLCLGPVTAEWLKVAGRSFSSTNTHNAGGPRRRLTHTGAEIHNEHPVVQAAPPSSLLNFARLSCFHIKTHRSQTWIWCLVAATKPPSLQILSEETMFHGFDGVTTTTIRPRGDTRTTTDQPLVVNRVQSEPLPPVKPHPITQNPKKQSPRCYFKLNGTKQLQRDILFLPFSSLINLSTSSAATLSPRSRGKTGKRSRRRRRAFKGP